MLALYSDYKSPTQSVCLIPLRLIKRYVPYENKSIKKYGGLGAPYYVVHVTCALDVIYATLRFNPTIRLPLGPFFLLPLRQIKRYFSL